MERRAGRFFWADPAVVMRSDASADEFREAMSAIQVGDTIKITGANRQPLSDALLIDNVDLTDACIVDIGASDGSTSVDLIKKVGAFGSYIIADLFFYVSAVRSGKRVLFFDSSGKWILVVGPRFVAWPSLSKPIRLLYSGSRRAAVGQPEEHVLLLNPDAQALINKADRVSFRVHDVFKVWDGPKPDVIKVANLLRRLYFSDADISRALRAILGSLDEGSHLLIVDNPRIQGIAERAGLYRRDRDRFSVKSLTSDKPEIDDLIQAVRLDKEPNW